MRSIQAHRRRLSGQEFANEQFSGLDLRNAIALASKWSRCHFNGVRFGQANFGDATFTECRFTDCDFGQAILVSRIRGGLFTRSTFDQASFVAAEIDGATFLSCSFQYANFQRATLTDATFRKCNFHGANLDFAETRNLDLRLSNLWAALIPLNCAFFEGTNFDRDQLLRFMALVDHSAGYRVWQPKDQAAYERQWKVVNRAMGDEGGVAESGRGEPEVGASMEEVGDGDSASREAVPPETNSVPGPVS